MDFSQYQKLLSIIDDIQFKLIVRLGFESCCRISEICNLQLKNIDFKDAQIYVDPQQTKTGIGGWIEVSEELITDIKAWLIADKRIKQKTLEPIKPDEYLFQSRQTRIINNKKIRKFTRNRLRQLFNKFVEEAGFCCIKEDLSQSIGLREKKTDKVGDPLRQFTFHSLRHSGIMHMIHDLRLPLDIVRAKSRHTTLLGLSHYAKPSESLVRKEIRSARRGFAEKNSGDYNG